jgi:hypothetical protein
MNGLWLLVFIITAGFILKILKWYLLKDEMEILASSGVEMNKALLCLDCDYLFESPRVEGICCPKCMNRAVIFASQLFGSVKK